MQLSTHLSFKGQCKEAFQLYEKVLNGKITFSMTYGEMPGDYPTPADFRDKIMHTSLVAEGQVIMGADAPPDRYVAPQGFSVSIHLKDPAEAERIYNALAEGATIQMPLQATFWSPKFGALVDRFGTPWMINTEGMQPPA